LVPAATIVALLVNPTTPTLAETMTRDLQAAAGTLGLQLHALHASNEREIDAAFAALVRLRASALVIGADALFNSRSEQLAALTLRHAVPAIYQFREFASASGLMSYGTTVVDTYRPLGVYTGRILKGEKPAELPVQQATKLQLIINARWTSAGDVHLHALGDRNRAGRLRALAVTAATRSDALPNKSVSEGAVPR
jgi:putative ABC transport system substrate-binding protein